MKIFGIGLSKTGTTSLAQALEILGYKAIHNPTYMLSINNDVLELDYSEVDLYDALTDIQMARFYKELDARYPGSKFILTTRDVEGWLASCENHFNEFRSTPETSKALDIAIYGTHLFDREKYKNAYFQHYDDVVQYFIGRENDLLILDILEKDKWQKLCSFLNKPIPIEPYPNKNKAIPVPLMLKNFVRRFPVGQKVVKVIKRMVE